MEYAIEIENLSVYIGGKRILDNINIKIPRNTIFAIMGPSGSGKSTLLRVINRLIDMVPNAQVHGNIKVFGKNIYSINPYVLRRKIGMVFQTPNPFPHMSIYDNIAIAARMNGIKTRDEINRVVEWALRKAMLWDEIKDRLGDPPTKLSGGQRQRLCLARALAQKPDILLLDEPTASIDPVNTRKIEETLLKLKNNMTIVLVTHLPRQAARIADYVALLYMGKVIEYGPTKEVFNNPRNPLTREFLNHF